MKEKIVVVDDEVEITDLIELYLVGAGYEVVKFYSGEGVLSYISSNAVDMAILDIMLPGVNGYELCEEIRKTKNFPIIMLTAKGEEIDKIHGLSIGADAYLTKPFRPLELTANVKAQFRRYKQYNKTGEEDLILTAGSIYMDRNTRTCFVNEKELNLTPTEFSILWTLCERKGKAVPAETLFFRVWGEKYYSQASNTIMVHIRHLREKMGDTGNKPKYIKTVWGVGYKIDG